MPRPNVRGFILPLSVLLVVVLTISGTAFMQHDFLERRMAMNTVDNKSTFYLANAGIERARETFKIDTNNPIPTWTPILTADPSTCSGVLCYTIENPPDPVLCPPVGNCIIPKFGPSVDASSARPFPFDPTFNQGVYRVRAFNDNSSNPPGFPSSPGETGSTDANGILIFRALANIGGEQKVLQAVVKAVSGLSLITGLTPHDGCPGPSPCPESITGNATSLINVEGRDPKVVSTLPSIDFAFYSTPSNFPWTSTTFSCSSGITCSGNSITVNVQDGGFYLIDGLANPSTTTVNVNTSGNTTRNVVVYSQAQINVQSTHTLTNTIIISQSNVQLQGSVTLCAPMSPILPPCNATPPVPVVTSTMYPAIISGGNVGGDQGVTIYGNVYSLGNINFRPISVHGLLVATDVSLQGSTLITDDGNPAIYSLMPGVNYPNELKTTVLTTLPGGGGGWQEIQ